MAIQYPLINGERLSYSAVEARFDGSKIIGFKSLNYDDSLEVGKVYGTASQKLGRTGGRQDSTGKFDMLMEEWQRLITKLAAKHPRGAFGKVPFDIICQFQAADQLITHSLIGCRITKPGIALSEGTDALMVGNDIDVMIIDYGNGITLAGSLDLTNLSGL